MKFKFSIQNKDLVEFAHSLNTPMAVVYIITVGAGSGVRENC